MGEEYSGRRAVDDLLRRAQTRRPRVPTRNGEHTMRLSIGQCLDDEAMRGVKLPKYEKWGKYNSGYSAMSNGSASIGAVASDWDG